MTRRMVADLSSMPECARLHLEKEDRIYKTMDYMNINHPSLAKAIAEEEGRMKIQEDQGRLSMDCSMPRSAIHLESCEQAHAHDRLAGRAHEEDEKMEDESIFRSCPPSTYRDASMGKEDRQFTRKRLEDQEPSKRRKIGEGPTNNTLFYHSSVRSKLEHDEQSLFGTGTNHYGDNHGLTEERTRTNSSHEENAFQQNQEWEEVFRHGRMWREKLCEWAYQVTDHFDLRREVVSVAMNYLDRYAAAILLDGKEQEHISTDSTTPFDLPFDSKPSRWVSRSPSWDEEEMADEKEKMEDEAQSQAKIHLTQLSWSSLVSLFDDKDEYALLAMTCLSLAIKLYEYKHIHISGSSSTMQTVLYLGRQSAGYTMQQIEEKECDVLHRLKWNLHPPTPQLFLHLFAEDFLAMPALSAPTVFVSLDELEGKNGYGDDHITGIAQDRQETGEETRRLLPSASERELHDLAVYIIEISVMDYYFVAYKPSEVALAALATAANSMYMSVEEMDYNRVEKRRIGMVRSRLSIRVNQSQRVKDCQRRLEKIYFANTTRCEEDSGTSYDTSDAVMASSAASTPRKKRGEEHRHHMPSPVSIITTEFE